MRKDIVDYDSDCQVKSKSSGDREELGLAACGQMDGRPPNDVVPNVAESAKPAEKAALGYLGDFCGLCGFCVKG